MAQQRIQQPVREEQRGAQMMQSDLRPVEDLIHYFREYARERPEMVAMACFGAGFILGWRLKPW
jgi:hypothetical protein